VVLTLDGDEFHGSAKHLQGVEELDALADRHVGVGGAVEQLLDFRQELRSWTQEASQSQTEEPAQLGRPVEDEEPKPQASFSKAVNDLLFGAHSPAAEDKRDLPLTDQTK